MKMNKTYIAIMGLVLAASVQGELLNNGDFSTGTDWWWFDGGTITDVGGANGNVATLTDANPDAAPGYHPLFLQGGFGDQTGTLTWSFDYSFTEAGGWPWRFFLENGNTYARVFELDINADRVGLFTSGGWVNIAEVDQVANVNDWYRFSATVDLAAGTAIGSVYNLTKAQDVTQNWSSPLGLVTGAGSMINKVVFQDLDEWSTSTTSTYVDNVSLVAVPEPATLGMVALFGTGLLVARRRMK